MIKRYRKKPVVIEAVQFEDTAENLCELTEFVRGQTVSVDYKDPKNPTLKIETLEGIMTANVGDYIIKGVKGEYYPCKPDIFEQTYAVTGG
ncbi:MAG: hypothetical protein IJR33_10405 [Clostridia bacterium]|nr:hypothetical protein [Clostridia bacterium]